MISVKIVDFKEAIIKFSNEPWYSHIIHHSKALSKRFRRKYVSWCMIPRRSYGRHLTRCSRERQTCSVEWKIESNRFVFNSCPRVGLAEKGRQLRPGPSRCILKRVRIGKIVKNRPKIESYPIFAREELASWNSQHICRTLRPLCSLRFGHPPPPLRIQGGKDLFSRGVENSKIANLV